MAGARVSAGSPSRPWLTLIPIPQTTVAPDASSRIPASFSSSRQHVVRPLHARLDPRLPFECRCDRQPGDERELRQRRSGRRQQQHREEKPRRGLVLPDPAGAPASGRLVLGDGDGAVRVGAVAQHVLRRAEPLGVEVGRARGAAQQPGHPLRSEITHRARPGAGAWSALRRFFDSRRCSFAARDGFVGTRARSTFSASASRATSRSIASSRLRSWLRSSCATARSTGPAFAITRRFWLSVSAVDGLDVEHGLDACLGRVRVLAAGAARARHPQLDLGERQEDGARHAPVGALVIAHGRGGGRDREQALAHARDRPGASCA